MSDILGDIFGDVPSPSPVGGGDTNQQQNQGNNQGQGGYQQQPSNQGGYQQNNNQGGYQQNNNKGGYQQNNNQGGGNNWNSGGGNNNWKSGGNNNWKGKNDWRAKQNEIQEPYLPVSIYIGEEFPADVKQNLMAIADKLISLGYTVRFNADEKDITDAILAKSDKCEGYVPFKGFNEIQTRHGFNNATSKYIAGQANPAYEKLPKIVQLKLARNVRLMFGDRNNSNTMALITWSQDGAREYNEVNKETGYVGDVIKLASKYKYPVININRQESKSDLQFLLEGVVAHG